MVTESPGVWGIPNAVELRTKSQVDKKWVWWLHSPFRVEGP